MKSQEEDYKQERKNAVTKDRPKKRRDKQIKKQKQGLPLIIHKNISLTFHFLTVS
jgi:hypothetical protein